MADDAPPTEEAADTAVEPEPEPEPEPETLHGALVSWSRGQQVLHPSRDAYSELLATLHADGYVVGVDLTGVDYLTHPGRTDLPDGVVGERFEVVVSLLSPMKRARLRLRIQVPADDPVVPSCSTLHPGLEAHEREAFDMYGVHFENHPDHTRILMPEDWVGHPLRKDYDSGRIPVQFKAPSDAR